jgi:O-antigen/teichoic acid export membrane protein
MSCFVLKIFATVKALLLKFEVNRGVLYSLLTHGWSALAGPVSMLVIAYWLSAEEQGFYYTFSSVLAMQIFVELGLATVIVQVASHEWAFLQHDKNGKISGEPRALSRLASLMRFALRWYFVSGLFIMLGLNVGGYFFFMAKPHPEIAWQMPWFALCCVAGLALMMSPFFSIIEGCNQIASIYSFRFVQGVVSTMVVIVSMLLGYGLYALAISALVRFASGVVFIGWKQYDFICQLLTTKVTERINWLKEVWPFQWRIGVSWMSGYFIFSIFTPVMFYYHGAKVAGQMGMTWSIVSMIEVVSYAWINTRMPQFGILIAKQQYEELDSLFGRLFLITVGIAAACALIAWLLIYSVHALNLRIADRLLPILPVTLFLMHRVFNVMLSDMAFYLRAHKKEPMMIPSVISALLAGVSTWLLGASYGPTGAAAGFLALVIVWGLPSCYVVFAHCRKKWHVKASPIGTDHSVSETVL